MPSYLVPAGSGEAVFTERGSRFIGVCGNARDEEAVRSFLRGIREKYPGAAHYVYAYRLRGGPERFSDDGEPSGTAGSPVYEVLTRRELYDAVLVVTRYFGGTLLGAGGLVRAYSRAAVLAADAAGVTETRLWREGTVTVPYALYEQAARLLGEREAQDMKPDFGAEVTVRFRLPEEGWDGAVQALANLTAGRCRPV